MEQLATAAEADKEFAQAMAALAREDTLAALANLERALKLRDNPGWHSYLGYCIAKERGQQRQGLDLCLSSIAAEPDEPGHHYNLGRVHLLGGDKLTAMRTLREGMAKGGSPELIRLLEALGTRKEPPISMLSRSHPINRFLGLLLSRIGLR